MFLKQFPSRILILLLLIAGAGTGYWLGHNVGQPKPVYAVEDPPLAVPQTISTASSMEEILMLMLRGYERWQSVNVQGETSDFSGHEISNHLILLQKTQHGPYFVRGEFGLRGKTPPAFYVLDGEKLWQADTSLKIYTNQPYHDDGLYPPETLPTVNSAEDPIIPHPLETQVPSPLVELLFPAGLAQSMSLDINNVSILKTDELAGRPTVVVQWLPYPGKQLFWVDTQTGTILKREDYSAYSPEGELVETWYGSTEITNIIFNENRSPSEFQFPSDKNLRLVQPLEFRRITSDDWVQQLDKQLLEKGK